MNLGIVIIAVQPTDGRQDHLTGKLGLDGDTLHPQAQQDLQCKVV